MDLARLFFKKKIKKQYEYISRCYFDAIYPVFIPKIKSNNTPLILSLFSILRDLNDLKPTRILNTLGYNNIAGFINVCLTRTGFPNALCFSEVGPLYNPYEFNSEKLMKSCDLQIFLSNLNFKPNINYFKKNIFIGHPSIKNKNSFDVFIPTKIPGIDSDGLIMKHDLISLIKLSKIFESNYPKLDQVFELISD